MEDMDKEQHCIICKKKITNPKSVERRMGNKCHSKYMKGCAGIQARIGGI